MSVPALAVVRPAHRVQGRIRLPGDKSISHRYAMLAALADGRSRVEHYAPGADCASTLTCLARLGVAVSTTPPPGDAEGEGVTVTIEGRGLRGLKAPAGVLDAGNSGTTLRLLAGILAAHPFETTLTGDPSLRRRPMRRIMDPLVRMGAEINAADDRPPLVVRGTRLHGIDYGLPVASAQVKSAILLAGLQAEGVTTVREPLPTRNHTELALAGFDAPPRVEGTAVTVAGGRRLRGGDFRVPGDFSSAVFWAVAAAGLPGSDVELGEVGLNPTRTALLDVLRRYGATVDVDPGPARGAEPCGTIRVRAGGHAALQVTPDQVPGLIDELPALAALATFGGELVVTGAAELRAKESDRITALVAGLRGLGADADELGDGFVVRGGDRLGGGTADAVGDHRLAMAFAVAAAGAAGPSTILGAEAVQVSYPGFFEILAAICE